MLVLYKGGYFEDINITNVFVNGLMVPYSEFRVIFKYCNGLDNTQIDQNANEINIYYRYGTGWDIKVTLNGITTTYNDLQDYFIDGEFSGYFMIYYDNSFFDFSVMDNLFNVYNQNKNVIFTFRMNDERHKVNKNLIFVNTLVGDFRSGINIINPVLNIQNFNIENTFNYVFLSTLNRFYYVNNIEVTTKNMTALLLHEDVLMSHLEVIYMQSAFIDRQENDYNLDLIDELVITEYNKNVEYTAVTYSNNIFTVGSQSYTGDFVVLTVNDETI